MFVTWIAKLVAALNSNRRPGEIAAGAAFGLLLALVPAGNLLWILLFAVTFFLKINLGIEMLVLAILKLFVFLLDGLLHSIGLAVLTAPPLFGWFTWLYNMPTLPFFRFQNTVVMGGFLVGLLLWLPAYFLAIRFVRIYRDRLRDRIASSKVVQGFTRLPLVSSALKAVRKAGSIYDTLR